MKNILGIVIVLGLILGNITGCAKEASTEKVETVVWKVAYEEIEGSIHDAYAKKFKELIEAKFEGRVTVELYPAGQLGFGSAQIELLQAGGVEFVLNYAAAVATIIPETQVLSLSFLFPPDEEVCGRVLTEGECTTALDELFLENNMKSLNWFNMGFMNWTSNKPLRTVEDFKGFKMRTMASPTRLENYKILSANPTPVPYMEVYSSLQLNMIDGQENPTAAIQEMKFYEVQDYLTISKHSLLAGNLITNVNFWNGLGEEDQALVNSCFDEIASHVVEKEAQITEERTQIIIDEGSTEVIELTADERAAFAEISLPVRDIYIAEAGDRSEEILNLLLSDIERFSK